MTENNDGGNENLEIAVTGITGTDELAKVTANDTTANYLFSKIVAGTGITINELNDGGNETLEIVNNAPDTDELVKVSGNDSTPGYLFPKLVAGNNIDITEQNDGGNETVLIDVETLTKSDISDFVEGDYVHTTMNENVAGVKTFTEDVPIVIDSPSTAGNFQIGYTTGSSIDCYGFSRTDGVGVICIMGNSDNPQIFLGHENNTTGSGFIDVDNNRPLNLNVLDTGAGSPAVVNIGSGGLNINSGGDLDLDGGDITLAATRTVDGVDVGSPKNSIEVDGGQYQLVGDQASPGNTKKYGTDGAGVKGWYDDVSGTDENVKVSANDTTSGFLNGKLVAGTGITLNEINDGGNETFEIVNSSLAGTEFIPTKRYWTPTDILPDYSQETGFADLDFDTNFDAQIMEFDDDNPEKFQLTFPADDWDTGANTLRITIAVSKANATPGGDVSWYYAIDQLEENASSRTAGTQYDAGSLNFAAGGAGQVLKKHIINMNLNEVGHALTPANGGIIWVCVWRDATGAFNTDDLTGDACIFYVKGEFLP